MIKENFVKIYNKIIYLIMFYFIFFFFRFLKHLKHSSYDFSLYHRVVDNNRGLSFESDRSFGRRSIGIVIEISL